MGAYSNSIYAAVHEETRAGPTVASAPGHFVMIGLNNDPEPVLAWKVGEQLVLPITRHGFMSEQECFIQYPDGKVRFHGLHIGSEVPDFASVAEWRADAEASAPVPIARMITEEDERDERECAKAIPAGVYTVQVIDSEIVEITSGNRQLKLTLEITDGQYKNTHLWHSIGKRALADLFSATGAPTTNDSRDLFFRRFMATVTADGIITAYKPIDWL